MKKKTKKAAKKPRPKTVTIPKTSTILAWNNARIVVRVVAGTEEEIEAAICALVDEVCPMARCCWQRFDGRPTVELRR